MPEDTSLARNLDGFQHAQVVALGKYPGILDVVFEEISRPHRIAR
jgi:hypothetical protein